MSNKVINISWDQSVQLGCDPEFFFMKNGQVIGSEKVLPKNGIPDGCGYGGKTIIDGVQAELNPVSSNCRESLAYQIFICFNSLKKRLEETGATVAAESIVDISQKELESLSKGSRLFGCAPSVNIYNENKDKTSKISANPTTYLKRSAGGHIHLGNAIAGYIVENSQKAIAVEKALKEMPEVMVPILDIIVGNTCVLLDRNEGNVERRKNYGRAGEYRLKPYGIEYRTLSNFWLRSYSLFSLVFALARMSVHIVAQSTKTNDNVKLLFDAVKREDVVEAIQKNDFDLAMKNFKKIKRLLQNMNNSHPLAQDRMGLFMHFIDRGLDYWYKQTVWEHWTKLSSTNGILYNQLGGWEKFCDCTIQQDLYTKKAMDLSNPIPAVAVA